MERYGKIPQKVANDMKVKHSTLIGMIDGNPTAKTLKNIANAIGCPIWEFFIDEMKEEDVLALLESLRQKQKEEEKKPEDATAKEDVQQATNADDLPFTDDQPAEQEQTQQAQEVKAVRFSYDCPHCGHQVTVTIE